MTSKVKLKECMDCLERKPATKTYFNLSANMQGLESRCRRCKTKLRKTYNYKKEKESFTTYLNGNDEIYC